MHRYIVKKYQGRETQNPRVFNCAVCTPLLPLVDTYYQVPVSSTTYYTVGTYTY